MLKLPAHFIAVFWFSGRKQNAMKAAKIPPTANKSATNKTMRQTKNSRVSSWKDQSKQKNDNKF